MKSKIKMNFKKITISILAFVITLSCFSGVFNFFGVLGDPTYLVNAGVSDYKIVIAEQPDPVEKTGSYELQEFFGEATGVTLPIISDSEVTENGKYISIGNTSLVTSQISSELEGLKSNGYLIKTVGQTVYLIGPSVYGSLAAVYGFLKEAFDFEYYFTDIYDLKTNVTSLALENYNVKVNPDIDGMTDPGVGFIQYDLTNKNRFVVAPTNYYFIPANGTTETHNLWYIMPQSWGTDPQYEKWFSDNAQKTACFTAHGDADAYDRMTTHFSQVAIEGMKISKANIFTVAQPDNCGFCNCETCQNFEGGNSAVVIQFCNDIAKKVDEWLESNEGQPYKRDFKLMFLAYQAIASAPSNKLKCADNVGVYLAFDSCNSSYALNANQTDDAYDSTNATIYKTINAWKEVTNNFIFWLYDVNFNRYFYPYDTTDYKVDFYKLMKEVGTILVNDLGQHQNKYNNTAWGNVKGYLSAKLRWDVNLDVNETVRSFFNACYKDAADIMYDVYCQYKAHWALLRHKGKIGEFSANEVKSLKSIFGDINKQKYWERDLLEGWVNQFEKAIDVIEPMKTTDPETYQRVYEMIAAEISSPLAMLIELYSTTYSPSKLSERKAEFKKYSSAAKILYTTDGTTNSIENYYSQNNI